MKKVRVCLFGLWLIAGGCTVGEFDQRDNTVISTRPHATGRQLTFSVNRGPAWFHKQRIGVFELMITPQVALWAQDRSERLLQTLYVTRRFAKQEWAAVKYPDTSCIRTMSLPYWFNRYCEAGNAAPTRAAPLPDGLTGATPTGSFTLHSRMDADSGEVTILMEINKSFDNNPAFARTKDERSLNGQPALVYGATVDLAASGTTYTLKPLGRSGMSGEDGHLYTSLAGIDSALEMVRAVTVRVE